MDFFLQKKYKRKGYNGKASISIYLNIFLSQNYTSVCTLLLIVYCIAVDSREVVLKDLWVQLHFFEVKIIGENILCMQDSQ